MAKPKPKRTRPRTGYVQVELTHEERAALVRLRDRLQAQTGMRLGLAAAFRWLLLREVQDRGR